MPSMLLLIDNYDSFTYNLFQLIAQSYPNVLVRRNDSITLDEITALCPKGIIISPGPGRPEDAGICIDVISHFAPTIPLLGVCLGLQAMAVAFGGKVIRAPMPIHGKRSHILHQEQGLFKNLPNPLEVGRYHSLIVDKISLLENCEVHAETTEGIVMAMRHRDYPSYGLQFHPESILTAHGADLIENFIRIEL